MFKLGNTFYLKKAYIMIDFRLLKMLKLCITG